MSEYINKDEEKEVMLALDIALLLDYYVRVKFRRLRRTYRHRLSDTINDTGDFWNKVSYRFYDTFSEKLNSLYPRHPRLCVGAFFRKKLPLHTLVDYFGVPILFQTSRVTSFTRGFYFPVSTKLLESIGVGGYSGIDKEDIDNALNDIREIGNIFLHSKHPWVERKISGSLGLNIHDYYEYGQVRNVEIKEIANPGASIFFGIFALLATHLEIINKIPTKLLEMKSPFIMPILAILSGRFKKYEENIINDEINHCGFSNEQKSLLWGWIRREINLFKSQGNKKRGKASATEQTE